MAGQKLEALRLWKLVVLLKIRCFPSTSEFKENKVEEKVLQSNQNSFSEGRVFVTPNVLTL